MSTKRSDAGRRFRWQAPPSAPSINGTRLGVNTGTQTTSSEWAPFAYCTRAPVTARNSALVTSIKSLGANRSVGVRMSGFPPADELLAQIRRQAAPFESWRSPGVIKAKAVAGRDRENRCAMRAPPARRLSSRALQRSRQRQPHSRPCNAGSTEHAPFDHRRSSSLRRRLRIKDGVDFCEAAIAELLRLRAAVNPGDSSNHRASTQPNPA